MEEIKSQILLHINDSNSQICSVKDNTSDILDIAFAPGLPSEVPLVRQDNPVGLNDEAETLINWLNEESEELEAISIIGMPGLGKTTLARKIFRDPKTQKNFPTRIWINVSQEFTRKDVFLIILRVLLKDEIDKIDDPKEREEMEKKKNDMTEEDLAQKVCEKLETEKFLIVMDDVWTAEAWVSLQAAFPKRNKMSRILITSRHEEVARQSNRIRDSFRLRLLALEESWTLLQLEVFGKHECPLELEIVGKEIARQCGGLPLAIVVIGGILVKKASSKEMSVRRKAWKKVSESMTTYLHEDPERRMENIILLSYNNLPYYLRPCFLYLGMFSEDFEILVWKLTCMWIAEGFIQQKPGLTLEDIAEDYLDELINRNLLMVDKVSPNGEVKTCRVHDMLCDFCINEADNENEIFFKEIIDYQQHPISNLQKYRRLCIHSNVLNFVTSKPHGPHVRSFVCFSSEEIALGIQHIAAIPGAFKLLRVLDVVPIRFNSFPTNLSQMVHLRYIVLSVSWGVLPETISNLWNLQTIIVYTERRILQIKANIWKMIQLRHFKTNAAATLPKMKKISEEGKKLQTLGAISPESLTREVFDWGRNLKKLSIRGKLAMLIDIKNGSSSFDSFEKLDNLEKLKLLNDVFPHPPSKGKLRGLPPAYKFPPKLRRLTLTDTLLDWRHMATLGLLVNLEVLKLKNYAFKGSRWEAAEGGFRNLEVLHIGHTNLVVWIASEHHFPRLRSLELRNCDDFREIPYGLADIPSLQMINLYNTTHATASAKKIHDAKQRMQGEQTTKSSGFKLSIFATKK